MMKRQSGQNANLAAEFFVASQLFRLGYTVTITLGNTKEIDLLVAHPDGRTVTIDVKGLKNRTNWPVNPKLRRKSHFYALVGYNNQFRYPLSIPEVFIIPSMQIKKYLSTWTGRPDIICVGYQRIRNTKYKQAWELLFR